MINMDTTDINNIEKRISEAKNLKANLEDKLKKLENNPRAETFKMQLEKVDGLISHLEREKENLEK